MSRSMSVAVLIALGAVVGAAPAAHAEVPAAVDFATCNAKAADETRTASAARGSGSGRPDDARGGEPAASPRTDVKIVKPGGATREPVDPTGKTITEARDPQVEGMAADRANDPRYVAAYRSCMRQRGF
jgi:hypothetical protein